MRLREYRQSLFRALKVESENDPRIEKLTRDIAWLHARGKTRLAALAVLKQQQDKVDGTPVG